MNSLISNGVPFDFAQGTPFIDFLGFHCVLKRTVLARVSTQSGTKTPKMALKDPHPPAPSPKAGEGEPEHKAKSLAPSPLVGEGWGEGEPMCPG
jgi:hypothetical protein